MLEHRQPKNVNDFVSVVKMMTTMWANAWAYEKNQQIEQDQ